MRLLHRDRTDHDDRSDDTTGAATQSGDERVRVAPASADRTMVHPTRDGDRDGDTAVAERGERVDRDEVTDATAPPAPTTVRERTWTFAPGQLVSFAAGAAAVVVGLIALLRAGVDASLAEPAVDVLGYSHTAWLGLAEIGLGVLLLLAGSGAWGRPLSVLLGAATVIAGVLVLVETDQMPGELGLERAFGWPLVVVGAVVALASMTLPVWRRRTITTD